MFLCPLIGRNDLRTWYKEGKYIPYTETDPRLLTELLARVKAGGAGVSDGLSEHRSRLPPFPLNPTCLYGTWLAESTARNSVT